MLCDQRGRGHDLSQNRILHHHNKVVTSPLHVLEILCKLLCCDIPCMGELRQYLEKPSVKICGAQRSKHQAVSRTARGDGRREGHSVAVPVEVMKQRGLKERRFIQQHSVISECQETKVQQVTSNSSQPESACPCLSREVKDFDRTIRTSDGETLQSINK